MSRSSVARCAAAATGLLLLLSGCGGSGGGAGHGDDAGAVVSATPTPSSVHPSGTVVRIKITSDSVDPDGSEVEATKGAPITFVINATEAGELHVHSSPEQHIAYPKGTSQISLTFKNPGIIDIESHALNKLIVQVEVR